VRPNGYSASLLTHRGEKAWRRFASFPGSPQGRFEDHESPPDFLGTQEGRKQGTLSTNVKIESLKFQIVLSPPLQTFTPFNLFNVLTLFTGIPWVENKKAWMSG
jgi:hypothetical protein